MSIVYLVAAFTLNSLANILMKISAKSGFKWQGLGIFDIVFQNKFILLALICFGLNFIFYFLALEKIALSVAYPVMNVMSIVIIFGFAVWYFHDSINLVQGIGYALMILGMVLVFAFSGKN